MLIGFTVAVGAFRVVVELDVKRRDNDKKIGTLFVEMRDMMEALLQCVHTPGFLLLTCAHGNADCAESRTRRVSGLTA